MDHLLAILFGFIGGTVPGGLHLAWKTTRTKKTRSGNIDITYVKRYK